MDAQLEKYKIGREFKEGRWVITNSKIIVTNARPGLSWHLYGLAFDSCWAGGDPYLENETPEHQKTLWTTYGRVGKAYGLRWGGDFRLVNGANDKPHMESPYGLGIDQAFELYQNHGIQGVWAYIDQLRGIPIGQEWSLKLEV